MEFYLRATLYLLTPALVLLLRKNELALTGALAMVFAVLAYGRTWPTIGWVLAFGAGMAALEALCIHFGMWRYFRVSNTIPLWLPLLWSITILFLWAVQRFAV
jgi:hypothetical protein